MADTRRSVAPAGPRHRYATIVVDVGLPALPLRRSIVEFRGMLEAVKGRQIMIDPQCGLFLGDDFGEQSMRGMCLLGVGIYRWHAIVIPIVLEMRGVARQHDPAGVAEMHKQ